jgi:hypothetical protein
MGRRVAIIQCCCGLLILAAPLARADEKVRQVQEELRRRNLYFGDVDGQVSRDLENALKRYQQRKGLNVTGNIDDVTASSLRVQIPEIAANTTAPSGPQTLPDLPVLRSDVARQVPPKEREALEKQGEENPDLVPTPAPPAEPPAPSQDITPDRIARLVENYLRDSETTDIAAQTRYFSYPVDYFDHGLKNADFVEKDVRDYVKRWPERKYVLMKPPSFVASDKEGETIVEFLISYDVHRPKYEAQGQTRNTWTIRPEGDDLKITSIHEQRIRPVAAASTAE